MRYLIPFLWSFGIIMLAELIVISVSEWWSYEIFTRPLICGSILVFFLAQHVNHLTKKLISLALIFSIIGDILLFYSIQTIEFYYIGVLLYVIVHILYTFQFQRTLNNRRNIFIPIIILLGSGIAMLNYLSDSLYDLVVPVSIYISGLLIMILYAYLRNNPPSNNSYSYVLTGAILFTISDILLSISMFKSDFMYSSILSMTTYSIAQLLITIGVLKSNFGIITKPIR